MNALRSRQLRRCRALAVCGVFLWAFALAAGTFTYSNPDLIAAFRRVGGVSDLVADLGPVSAFEGLPLRTSFLVTNVQAAQLAAAFPDLNGVSWSVSAAMRGNTSYPQFPLQTLWVTSPRPDADTPGAEWKRKGQFTQGTTAGQIDAIGTSAATYGSTQPAGANNTQSGIVIAATDANSYTATIAASGDFAGTFQGDAENTTPANFATVGTVSRSVLYKLLPGSADSLNAPGQVIGFFDLLPSGTMTFTAGPPPERAVIISHQVSGGVTTVRFATSVATLYRLRFSETLATPVHQWTTNGVVVVGDGTVQSLQGASGAAVGFYVVESF